MKKYENVLVLGLGASGVAAAELLAGEGAHVVAADRCRSAELAEKAATLEARGVSVRLGADGLPGERFDVCIASPGFAPDSEWIRKVEARGTEVISELELGASRCRCPMVAVTGSNGKSTLVKLVAESLAAGECRVEIGGNYGVPLSAFAAKSGALDWIVVEVSSFQLEKVRMFRPRVGVLLNVNPNHLNRHGDFATYVGLKSRLFARLEPDDTAAVLDVNIEEIRRLSGGRGRWVSFGISEGADYVYREGIIRRRGGPERGAASVEGTLFANDVMGVTASAAVAVAEACGLSGGCVERAARAFQALPHRMSRIATVRGVTFIDDSKATNLAAMAAALDMCEGPVRLIAGGQMKEDDLQSVRTRLARKVKAAYLIGEAAPRMAEAWSGAVTCRPCATLEKACRDAWADALAGETILLSPAGASFDQFKSYEERGNRFIELVGNITKER